MRPNNQNNKNRQRGRNGGRKHVNPLSRNFESNGPDVKVRGNAAHVAEKYLQLARDAQSSGDSVMAENYLQHAEHYFRIVSSAQQAQNGQRPDGQDDDFDDDMPDMNSRFASPQPPQQQYVQQAEGEEQGEGEQNREQGQPRQDGERQQRGDRRDRQRNRERFRPEGEGPQPVVAAESAQPAAVEETAAAGEQPVEAEGEARKPRERRPRRRRPAGGDGGDLAGADQPDVGELPAFLTAGGSAAE
ncbi:DUF4167 domain-containing protein [Devosia sp. Root436]|uniref:DUF4167 domain-containing protein n=1 Tax=Devosia sp. Root436 TaxID=1736537 RepID=UPI0009E6F0F6|nr:DUF4167 domain-containing protein [Devosia sp. Root436]PJI37595.1 MAG: DUF4167 domain-containing protein [Rhizobium sp.]